MALNKVYIRRRTMEDYGYILYIKELGGHRLIGQILGEFCFTLMEFQLNREAVVKELERVYIGRGPRAKVTKFIRYISYDDLSYRARENLPEAIEKAILMNEDYWVNFFNKAGPLTMRTHTLELLKNIGKKTVLKIISEREREPFKSFKDIRDRVGIDPLKIIAERVLDELKEDKTYYLFVCK